MKLPFVLRTFVLACFALTISNMSVNAQTVSQLSQQQQVAQQQKDNLQKEVKKIQRQIEREESTKKDVIDRLRESEKSISALNATLDKLQQQQDAAKQEVAELRQQARERHQLLDQSKEDLADQLYAQYTSGLSAWTALLSGQDAQKIGRDLGYLGYISRSRVLALKDINQQIEQIQGVEAKILERQKSIKQLVTQTQSKQQELKQEQQKYQINLRSIADGLKQRRSQAGRLLSDQKRLDGLINTLETDIVKQKEADRQAEIARARASELKQQQLAEQQRLMDQRAQAQAAQARIQAEHAAQLKQVSREASKEAWVENRVQEQQLKQAQNELQFADDPQQIEEAKIKIQHALAQQKQSQQQLSNAIQQSENAEIERAKARLAQQKAFETRRLAQAAKEDEHRARIESSMGGGLQAGAPWPLRGELQGRFGTIQADTGGVRRGILIQSAAGTPVKAIASGQVVYANWMRGFGNLIIINHGNNYMSVYGYNQSLTKSVGDQVATGQTIARAGASGGQVEPALYFEIRRGSTAIDPLTILAP